MKGPARADDLTVFSVAESPITFLEKPICFMPSGSLVAGFQKRPVPGGKISKELAFWEKNCLRHGEFVLPDQTQNVLLIDFNPDSSLMALLCMDDNKTSMTILICVRSNWKWTVKQSIRNLSMAETKGIRSMKWMFNKK